jgi:hypothetical protein
VDELKRREKSVDAAEAASREREAALDARAAELDRREAAQC